MKSPQASNQQAQTLVKCPNCQTPAPYLGNPNRPFCSERCKLIDFGEWATESYKIAAEDSPMSEDS